MYVVCRDHRPSFARTVAYCGYVLPPELIDPADADRMANVVYIEHQLAQAKEQQARDEVRLMRSHRPPC